MRVAQIGKCGRILHLIHLIHLIEDHEHLLRIGAQIGEEVHCGVVKLHLFT